MLLTEMNVLFIIKTMYLKPNFAAKKSKIVLIVK